eukprot:2759939-Pyramimonas_sp.AAC.1
MFRTIPLFSLIISTSHHHLHPHHPRSRPRRTTCRPEPGPRAAADAGAEANRSRLILNSSGFLPRHSLVSSQLRRARAAVWSCMCEFPYILCARVAMLCAQARLSAHVVQIMSSGTVTCEPRGAL